VAEQLRVRSSRHETTIAMTILVATVGGVHALLFLHGGVLGALAIGG
jgi:hypothetical protein